MSSMKLDSKLLAEVAVTVALGTVLSNIKVYQMPYGGSLTLASMVPLFLLSMRRGPYVGVFAGAVHGMVQLALQPYILTPIQVIIDYPLPFACIGLAGFFKKIPLLGVVVGIAGRFLSHFVSGVVFWYMYTPEGMTAVVYSAVYNGSYLIGELIISAIVVYLLIKRDILSMYL
jgi:thiamine transporter